MQLPGPESPADGWGENVQRLLERAATTHDGVSVDPAASSTIVSPRAEHIVPQPVEQIAPELAEHVTSEPAEHTTSEPAEHITPEPAESFVPQSVECIEPATSVPPESSARSTIENPMNGIPRHLPAHSSMDFFSPTASVFEIHTEPILPMATSSYPDQDGLEAPEAQQHEGTSIASDMDGVFATRDTGYAVASDDMVPGDPPVLTTLPPDEPMELPVDSAGPSLTFVRRASERMSSSRVHPMIHPVASIASISSGGYSDPGPSSLPSGSVYGESIRSVQSTPPAGSVYTPPLSPKRPMINTNYIRPISEDGFSMQTPMVEVGPSLSVRSWPRNTPKSLPPPYRNSDPPQSSTPTSSTPTRRRMDSFYAFAYARSDQILSGLPFQVSNKPVPRDFRPTFAAPAAVDYRYPRTSISSASSVSPPLREIRPHTEFTVLTEDTEVSAFAPRPPIAAQPPESYSAYHILPEDHTNRAGHPREIVEPPARATPPSLARKSLTDTFKEAFVEPTPDLKPEPHDSLKEVANYSVRPRHFSDSYMQYHSSEQVPRVAHAPQNDYSSRAIPSNNSGPQRASKDSYRGYDAGRDFQQISRPAPQQQDPYLGTSKDVPYRPPVQSNDLKYNIRMDIPSSEPRSQVELNRQRNSERKRGGRQPLRIVNM